MKTLSKIIILLLAISFQLSAISCFADIPHLINYQGKLTDKDNKPIEGTHAITFRIYDAETSGTLLWEETQSVTIQKGIFSVMLGGVTALNLAFDKPYWLEIKVDNEVMSPRQRMAAAPYAFYCRIWRSSRGYRNVEWFNCRYPSRLGFVRWHKRNT